MMGTKTDALDKRRPRIADRYAAFASGELTVEDLDDEEIMRGQLRNKDGGFNGRPPRALPREFHVAITQELQKRFDSRFKETMGMALETLVEIAGNKHAPADARFKAATYLIERTLGKIPDKQIISATISRWEAVAADIIIDIEDDE